MKFIGRQLSRRSFFPGLSMGFGFIFSVALAAGTAELRGQETHPSRTVHVKLEEWRVAVDQAVLSPGRVTFKAVNHGKLDHEMVVIKTEIPAHTFSVKGGKVVEDAVGVVMGEIEGFPPGAERALTLDLPEGHYVLFCNNVEDGKAEGHYQQGMHLPFKVSHAIE